METKHTPGEWVIEGPINHTINVTAGKKGFIIAQITSDCITHFIGNTEEAAANARLIAAAPKLLTTLQKLVDELGPHFYRQPVKRVFHELITINEATNLIYTLSCRNIIQTNSQQ